MSRVLSVLRDFFCSVGVREYQIPVFSFLNSEVLSYV